MRLLPRSLTRRLMATAIVAIFVALALSSIGIAHVLERFVMHSLDERLDAQIEVLSRAVTPEGTLDPRRAVDVPPFDRPGSGWAWEIIAPDHIFRSGSLDGIDLTLPSGWNSEQPFRRRAWAPWGDSAAPRPLDGRDVHGERLHYRLATVPTERGAISILAAAPRSIVERPLHFAVFPLVSTLLLLGVVLTIALVVQLRFGLRPLTKLTRLVGEVRDGQRRHIDVEEPTELLPLVAELNALIIANERALERARAHLANLAHGLKTPLATLRLDLAEPQIDIDGRLTAQVARMEAHIRHHLGRARAAESGGMAHASIQLHSCFSDLAGAMTRIYADKAIATRIDVPANLAVRCDPQDLNELFGNLLDNSWRWAHTTVIIEARNDEGLVEIVICDDGPGMEDSDIEKALIKGRRLDEREPGHGFGLSISRELVELHGGSLELGRSALGGLEVRVRLQRG